MAADQEKLSIEFAGSERAQTLAEQAFNVLRARGMFMSNNAPIRVTLDSVREFLGSQASASADEVDEALAANAAIFAIESGDDDVAYVVTTREGRSPAAGSAPNIHTFASRFHTPLPKPAVPATPKRERAKVDPSWANFSLSDYADLLDEEEDEVEATPAPTIGAEDIELILEPLNALAAAPAQPAPTEEAPATAPAVEEPAPEPAPAPATATSAVAGLADAAIADAIRAVLPNDVHVAHFGDQWMAEDRVPRLSRGDLRRIKEYIEEQEQPLTDAVLVQDVLSVRPNSAEFELMKFALNFRLSREHRDFEFVGTSDQRFWSTSNLPPIGTARRKPNEIGTDYRYLVEEIAEQEVAPRSVSSIDHIVTFYEYTLGLLPYDADMQRLLPAPLIEDQKTAVLTFEIPQLYTTYLAELRYPTPNRGGFLLGLDDLYSESLVPGSIIAISATENDGHYKVEFIASKDRSERLLELDDRRAVRYTFRPTTFASEVDDDWLLTEERFPALGSEKPLEERVRRRPEAVVEATFARIGVDDGNGGKMTTFAELLTAVNVERPFSRELLASVLESDAHVTADGDTYTYAAGA
ncbi:MAG: hypothetical protein ACTHQE_01240 [Thermomicrobiales bacterium]